jgi:S-adenosylmethionine hydrolase
VSMIISGLERPMSWVEAYGDVAFGSGLIHVDSYGQIAIAVRDGRADEAYPLAVRTAVTFRSPGGGRIPVGPAPPE